MLKIKKRYDKDLQLYLDMVKTLTNYQNWYIKDLCKQKKSKDLIKIEVYEYRRKIKSLINRLGKRLYITTIDQKIKIKKYNKKGYF